MRSAIKQRKNGNERTSKEQEETETEEATIASTQHVQQQTNARTFHENEKQSGKLQMIRSIRQGKNKNENENLRIT